MLQCLLVLFYYQCLSLNQLVMMLPTYHIRTKSKRDDERRVEERSFDDRWQAESHLRGAACQTFCLNTVNYLLSWRAFASFWTNTVWLLVLRGVVARLCILYEQKPAKPFCSVVVAVRVFNKSWRIFAGFYLVRAAIAVRFVHNVDLDLIER